MTEDDQDRTREAKAEREAEIEEETKRVGEDPGQVQDGESGLGKQSAASGEVREETSPDEQAVSTTGLDLDDVGKTVVDEEGTELGIVAQASGDDGAVHVDVEPGITERILSKLGWTGEEDVDYAVPSERIRSVTDDEVVLYSGDVDTAGE